MFKSHLSEAEIVQIRVYPQRLTQYLALNTRLCFKILFYFNYIYVGGWYKQVQFLRRPEEAI